MIPTVNNKSPYLWSVNLLQQQLKLKRINEALTTALDNAHIIMAGAVGICGDGMPFRRLLNGYQSSWQASRRVRPDLN